MSVIDVINLGKAYKQYATRWARLAEWLDPLSRPRHHLNWVLKDISFTVDKGESVGIVGVNGAGKSTLLKMIAGTTQPTIGRVRVRGRIAALLELGMGFHEAFTGRQNTLMAGQLLGFNKKDIISRFKDLEEFVELGEYMDQPLRVYSSGMRIRLAFGVATMWRPDVLIVDEALAVGDAYFKKKCLNRIHDYRSQGSTLLLVSHGIGDLQQNCNRAMLLVNGCLSESGEPKRIIELYNSLFQKS